MMKNFKIPEIKIPTLEEHYATSDTWYSCLKGMMLDELPNDVMELSVPTKFIEVPHGALDIFYGDKSLSGFDTLASELDKAMDWQEHFIKLNSRSAKDSWDGITCSGRHALVNMANSMRIIDDITQFKYLRHATPKICMRELFCGANGMGTWEFRCFVKDGILLAVSDYDYGSPNKHLKDAGTCKDVREKVNDFFENLHKRMTLETYVFDVVFNGQKWILIEINPYGLSDPCFFGSYANVEASTSYIQMDFPK